MSRRSLLDKELEHFLRIITFGSVLVQHKMVHIVLTTCVLCVAEVSGGTHARAVNGAGTSVGLRRVRAVSFVAASGCSTWDARRA